MWKALGDRGAEGETKMRRSGAGEVPETISRKKEKERDWRRGLKEDGPAAGGPTAEGFVQKNQVCAWLECA